MVFPHQSESLVLLTPFQWVALSFKDIGLAGPSFLPIAISHLFLLIDAGIVWSFIAAAINSHHFVQWHESVAFIISAYDLIP